MDWLSSPIWNLFYFAATLVMMAFAYYSRHEYVQKLALLVLASWILDQSFNETIYELPMAYVIDCAGLFYAWYLLSRSDWQEPTAFVVMMISWLMIVLHLKWTDAGVTHAIAYNLLYLSQLVVLSLYGKKYGVEARQTHSPRTDLYFRILTYAHRG